MKSLHLRKNLHEHWLRRVTAAMAALVFTGSAATTWADALYIITGAQQQILEKAPEWIEKYGQNSAYFCTNDAHTAPLIKQLLEYGGYFIEADLPSPLMGYPDALGVERRQAEDRNSGDRGRNRH